MLAPSQQKGPGAQSEMPFETVVKLWQRFGFESKSPKAAVFKTVAPSPARRGVGSTPMHSRQFVNLEADIVRRPCQFRRSRRPDPKLWLIVAKLWRIPAR